MAKPKDGEAEEIEVKEPEVEETEDEEPEEIEDEDPKPKDKPKRKRRVVIKDEDYGADLAEHEARLARLEKRGETPAKEGGSVMMWIVSAIAVVVTAIFALSLFSGGEDDALQHNPRANRYG